MSLFKFRKSLIIPLFATFTSVALGATNVCQKFPGRLSCGKGIIDRLPPGMYGTVSLNGTTVQGFSQLTAGLFEANAAKLNNVEIISGRANFNNSEINGKTIELVVGDFFAKDTVIRHNITVSSPEVSLKNVATQSLQINSEKPNKKLLLQLSGKTVINGNVTFNNNHGKVCISDDAILKGKVYGGVIVHERCLSDRTN